jgi:hypothetical protein
MLNQPDILTFSHTLYVEARDKIAANVAEKVPAIIKANKDFFTKIITPATRTTGPANQEIYSMSIPAANMIASPQPRLTHQSTPSQHKAAEKTTGAQEGDSKLLPPGPQESPPRQPHKHHQKKQTK